MKLYIKYMVSYRCILMVKAELDKLELKYKNVNIGEIDLYDALTKEQYQLLDASLRNLRLEILEDRKSRIIESIKNECNDIVYNSDDLHKCNFSDRIAEKLKLDYTYLSNLYMEVTATTIQHDINILKINRIKELLLYHDLTLSQISIKMHFSSLQHICKFFIKHTGYTTTTFLELKERKMDVK